MFWGSLREDIKNHSCSSNIHQPSAANLYKKGYTLLLDIAAPFHPLKGGGGGAHTMLYPVLKAEGGGGCKKFRTHNFPILYPPLHND